MTFTDKQCEATLEREMSAHQRGLVDTCLEEGQFESAVAVMEQLRSSNCKPAASHIRQLIYIALQPEHPPAVKEIVYTGVPSSPSKAAVKKRIPSGLAVSAARCLLQSFAMTNSPQTIARALPSCGGPRQDHRLPCDDGSLESVIGPQSMCIPKANNCWSILAEGFTHRGQSVSIASVKGKKRARNADGEEDSADGSIVEDAVIGQDAWSVLSWMIVLFEQDELLADVPASGRFSNLLLQQIPYPRSGSGPRWDADAPLRIVFFCLEQADLRRQTLGSRLMTLLINLSSTAHLDLPMFVASVYSHLTAAAPESLLVLLSSLSPSPAVHKFKIVLCKKFLTDSSHSQVHDARAKAHVRAQPRALRQKRTHSLGTEFFKSQYTDPATLAHPPRSTLPGFLEIRRLIETDFSPPSMTISKSLLLRIKFELLNSYGMLQFKTPSTEKDTEWLASLHDDGMSQILDSAFGRADEGGEGCIFREAIQSITGAW